MKKKEIVYEHQASSKDNLVALVYYPWYTKLLNPEGRPYEKFHQWLIDNEKVLEDEDRILPTIKEISKNIGLDSAKTAKHIKMVYDDILELNQMEPEKFVKPNQIKCYLSFEYHRTFASFNLGLNVIPRFNECFDFHFIKPKIGFSSYYVKRIDHSVENSEHVVQVYMTCGFPNLYFELLKEKAYLFHDISLEELFSGTTYDLEKKLLFRNNHL